MAGVTMDASSLSLAALIGIEPMRLEYLVAQLTHRQWTVAAAESLTAGLLTALLTEVPGASAVVRGGIVCYATDLKAALVGVDERLLAAAGPVDRRVAEQLADGVRQRCGADIGIGLTGVAGPHPQGGKPPGTVFLGIAGHGETMSTSVALPAGSPVDRTVIRAAAVRGAIDLLEQRLESTA